MDKDPQAYNPSEFLETLLGLPQSFTKPLLETIHKK